MDERVAGKAAVQQEHPFDIRPTVVIIVFSMVLSAALIIVNSASSGDASAAAGLLGEAMPTGVVFTTTSQPARASSRAEASLQSRGSSCGAQPAQAASSSSSTA